MRVGVFFQVGEFAKGTTLRAGRTGLITFARVKMNGNAKKLEENRPCKRLRRRALGNDGRLDADDMRGIMGGQGQIVADHDQSKAKKVAGLVQHLPEEALAAIINASFSLIQNQEVWLARKGGSEEDTPQLPAREFSEFFCGQLFGIHQFQGFQGNFFGL